MNVKSAGDVLNKKKTNSLKGGFRVNSYIPFNKLYLARGEVG